MRKFGVFGIVLFFLGLIVPIICLVKQIQFNQQCGGYLKQAADANSIELAIERLDIALNYIEAHDLTQGYTSVLWKTEDENVEYWYRNIKACRDELVENVDASPLQKSNMLMKVRESLTDDGGEDGVKITVPPGISRYPYNAMYGILRTISWIMICLGFCLFKLD